MKSSSFQLKMLASTCKAGRAFTRTGGPCKDVRVAGTREFLELSDAEAQFLEIKFSLARMLRQCREQKHLSQAQLAKKIGSSQSRVAKMEAGDPSVSVDLLMRSLLAVGENPRELGRTVSAAR